VDTTLNPDAVEPTPPGGLIAPTMGKGGSGDPAEG
jgi:hypothetical protein